VIPAFVNDAAGTAAEAREALERAGRFDVHDVAPREMERVLRDELAAHPRRILVAGGDGTIGTAAALVQGTETELAIFPGGTLNHFARDHGIPTDPAEAAACGCEGQTLHADVAFANDHLFLNTSSVGAYVTYVRLRERVERYVGYRLASIVAGIRLFFRLRPIRVTLEIEGKQHEYETPLVFIGVGERELKAPSFGSRIPGGEHCLHLLVVRERRAMRLLVVALEAMRRGLDSVARTPELDAYKVTTCTIALRGRRQHVALDGELVQVTSPVKYELRRGALTVVVPQMKGEAPAIAVEGADAPHADTGAGSAA
jgi:diacylglycerol kinase family enzyme